MRAVRSPPPGRTKASRAGGGASTGLISGAGGGGRDGGGGGGGGVLSVAASPDGRMLSACLWDGRVQLWDVSRDGAAASPPPEGRLPPIKVNRSHGTSGQRQRPAPAPSESGTEPRHSMIRLCICRFVHCGCAGLSSWKQNK